MGPSSRARLSIAAVITVLVLGAGCSSSSDDSSATTTTTTTATTTSSASTTTVATAPAEPVDVSSGDLPPTPIAAVVEGTARYDPAGQRMAFDETAFGVPIGSVTAAWYHVDGNWAVYFQGLRPEQATGKCLESDPRYGLYSVGLAPGPVPDPDASSSPYGALACQRFGEGPVRSLAGDQPDRSDGVLPWQVLEPGSLHLCGTDAVILTSTIGASYVGFVYAKIGQSLPDGSIQVMGGNGVSGYHGDRVVPAIDVSNCEVIS